MPDLNPGPLPQKSGALDTNEPPHLRRHLMTPLLSDIVAQAQQIMNSRKHSSISNLSNISCSSLPDVVSSSNNNINNNTTKEDIRGSRCVDLYKLLNPNSNKASISQNDTRKSLHPNVG